MKRQQMKQPRYFCYDCDKATAAVQSVTRDFYGTGSRSATLVCRKGTGCHKASDPYEQPNIQQHLNRDGQAETLCGKSFDGMTADVWDYRDGYDPRRGTACIDCAEKSARINA